MMIYVQSFSFLYIKSILTEFSFQSLIYPILWRKPLTKKSMKIFDKSTLF